MKTHKRALIVPRAKTREREQRRKMDENHRLASRPLECFLVDSGERSDGVGSLQHLKIAKTVLEPSRVSDLIISDTNAFAFFRSFHFFVFCFSGVDQIAVLRHRPSSLSFQPNSITSSGLLSNLAGLAEVE